MSYQTPHLHFIPPGLHDRIDLFFAAKGQGFNAAGLVRQRLSCILMMEAMSDAELAALGLRRDRILDFVFEDCFNDAGPANHATVA